MLVGLGSGNPKSLTGYADGVSALFHERALAILRATKAHGSAALTLTAEGYAPVERYLSLCLISLCCLDPLEFRNHL